MSRNTARSTAVNGASTRRRAAPAGGDVTLWGGGRVRQRRLPATISSAYADDVKTAVGGDEDGGVVAELAKIAEDKHVLARREEVAVRRARHTGLSWAEIGTLLHVTKQTMHRKYRNVG